MRHAPRGGRTGAPQRVHLFQQSASRTWDRASPAHARARRTRDHQVADEPHHAIQACQSRAPSGPWMRPERQRGRRPPGRRHVGRHADDRPMGSEDLDGHPMTPARADTSARSTSLRRGPRFASAITRLAERRSSGSRHASFRREPGPADLTKNLKSNAASRMILGLASSIRRAAGRARTLDAAPARESPLGRTRLGSTGDSSMRPALSLEFHGRRVPSPACAWQTERPGDARHVIRLALTPGAVSPERCAAPALQRHRRPEHWI